MSTNLTGTNFLTPQPSSSGKEKSQQARKLLLLATLLTLGLNFVPYSNYLLYPLRLFVTFIHESGHALASVLTGGEVVSLSVFPNGEGLTMSRGTPLWAWVMLSGGYVGTAIFGAILLQVGRMKKWANPGRTALYIAAVSIGLITLLWALHPLKDPFTLVVGLVMASVLFLMARKMTPVAANFTVSFLAVQCSLNALGDIRILLHLTTADQNHNDAGFMAQQYGMSPTFWAVIWAGMAIVVLLISLRSYLRATGKQAA